MLDSKLPLNTISVDLFMKLSYVQSSIGVTVVDSGPQIMLTESPSTYSLLTNALADLCVSTTIENCKAALEAPTMMLSAPVVGFMMRFCGTVESSAI